MTTQFSRELSSAISASDFAEHARGRADAAIAAKDLLHKQLGANIDAELERVTAAWRGAELALQTEQLAWIRAYGSPVLQQQATEALGVGRAAPFDWQPGVPLDWAQADRVAALQPQLTQEWMCRERGGWVLWDPDSFGATNVEPLSKYAVDDPVGTVPDLERTKAAVDFLRGARAQDAGAQMHQFELIEKPEGRWYRCAISEVGLPGGYGPVKIARLETPELAHELDRIAEYLLHPHTADRTYEETLAAIAEIEAGKSLAPLPEGIAHAVVQRLDLGPWREDATSQTTRAIVVTEDAAHLVLVDRESVQQSVGKPVRLLRNDDQRVFIEAPDAPIAMGFEDVDAMQQLKLRRELLRVAELERRPERVDEAARAQLHEISRRVETSIAACRAIEHGVAQQDDSPGPVVPKVDLVRHDSALAAERLAWMVTYGTPALARRVPEAEHDNALHAEWLRAQGGWRAWTGDGRHWKRVAVGGAPNTIHPASTLRDSAPVKEMLADAWALAADATLVASVEAPVGEGAQRRPVHAALIARRAPGSVALQPLIREESTKQRAQLGALWRDRLRARDPRNPIPLPSHFNHPAVRNEGERLMDRVQREFGVPAAPLPDARPVVGRLVRVERGADHRHRALVVNASHVHVVAIMPSAQLEKLVGKPVAVEKTAGRVRISGYAIERGLER